MPNRVHPPVHDVQLTALEARFDRSTPDASIKQLSSSYEAVL